MHFAPRIKPLKKTLESWIAAGDLEFVRFYKGAEPKPTDVAILQYGRSILVEEFADPKLRAFRDSVKLMALDHRGPLWLLGFRLATKTTLYVGARGARFDVEQMGDPNRSPRLAAWGAGCLSPRCIGSDDEALEFSARDWIFQSASDQDRAGSPPKVTGPLVHTATAYCRSCGERCGVVRVEVLAAASEPSPRAMKLRAFGWSFMRLLRRL